MTAEQKNDIESNTTDNGNNSTSDMTDNASKQSESTDDDTAKTPSKENTIINIPAPMIGGIQLPSPSIDTMTMMRRMQSRMPVEKTLYDAIAESTDEERIGMGYTNDVMSRCGAVKVRGEYPTRQRHDELLAEKLPPMLARLSRKMLMWMVIGLVLGITWAYLNGINWLIGVLIGIGIFILAAVGDMLGLMRDVRMTEGLDYCAAYESNVKAFDWEMASKMAEERNGQSKQNE